MFEDSLATASTVGRNGTVRFASAVSLGLQAAIAAVICIAPLFHPLRLSMPTPPAPLFVPILRQTVPRVRMSAAASPASGPATPSLPTSLPRIHSAPVMEEPVPATAVDTLPFAASGPPDAALRGVMSGRPVGPKATGDAGGDGAVSAHKGPVRVSSGVSAGLLLTPIRPVYPQIARAARMEGTVMVSAVISREGNVMQARVTAGPPMLAQAALDAVRAARYRPFRLNGEPTEVETTFSIVFRLGAM